MPKPQAPPLAHLWHRCDACRILRRSTGQEQAIKQAIKQFGINDPEEQKRLVARKVK
jgi:hypothetical protein